MVDATSLRDRALAVLETVTDPEIPVLTITDLGILRDVVVLGDMAHLLWLPGDEHDHAGHRNCAGAC